MDDHTLIIPMSPLSPLFLISEQELNLPHPPAVGHDQKSYQVALQSGAFQAAAKLLEEGWPNVQVVVEGNNKSTDVT